MPPEEKRYMKRFFIFFIIAVVAAGTVYGHVPIESGDNDTLESALLVTEPTKSWAIYDDLHHNEAKYYRFYMNDGERIRVQAFTPEKGSFSPGLVLMGPGITVNDNPPSYVELLEEGGSMVIPGTRSDAEYEPFTPTSYYYTAECDITVTVAGEYFLAVFEQETEGKVGIAIGYVEKFSPTEWLMIPIDVAAVHLWEGQHILLILAPLILTLTAGGALLYRRRNSLTAPSVIGFTASFLYIGSGLVIVEQMIIALMKAPPTPGIGITVIFALIPLLLGVGLYNVARKKERGRKERVKLLLYGALGYLFWAGVLVGPTLAVIGGIMPEK
jgi:hypothetical protein